MTIPAIQTEIFLDEILDEIPFIKEKNPAVPPPVGGSPAGFFCSCPGTCPLIVHGYLLHLFPVHFTHVFFQAAPYFVIFMDFTLLQTDL